MSTIGFKEVAMNLVLKIMILERFGNQANFGQQVGLREPKISRFIHGREEPKPEEKSIIAKALQIPEDELFPSRAEGKRCAAQS